MFTLQKIKSTKKITIDFKASLKDVLTLINKNKTGCAVLLDEQKVSGIITESDLIKAIQNKVDIDTKAINIANKNIISTQGDRPIDFAFDLLHTHNIKRIILQDKDGRYQGVVLQEDLIQYIESDVYKVDLKLKSIIDRSRTLFFVDKFTTLDDTLKLMYKNKIGSVLVKDDKEFVGIVTEKDIIDAICKENDTQSYIYNYMSYPIVSISQNTAVQDTIELMQIKQIRRVIVKDENENIISIVTNRDILQHLKGNYTNILQNKIKQSQEIMDLFPEPIVEIYCIKTKAIIS